MNDPGVASNRSKLRRMPQRGSNDLKIIAEVLDAGFLAHIGFVVDGQPFVIPTLYARDGEKLYIHGSAASRMLRELHGGIAACVTVTLVDGIVLARSAFNHSMNYRSAVVFGIMRRIENPEQKTEALRAISEHLVPGRWNDVRGPSEKELKATAVLEMTIEDASTKIRTGAPEDEPEDYSLLHWAGVLPLAMVAAEPVPDPQLMKGIEVPDYLRKYRSAKA